MLPVTTNAENRLPSLVIAIPIYKREFDAEEQYLVDRMFTIFANREIVFIAPKNLDKAYYLARYPSAKLTEFQDTFFESIQGYSRLLLSKNFYEVFKEKEFLLISQPDVYVFQDDLDKWLKKPYDYIGAPWPTGFSIKFNMGRFRRDTQGSTLTAFVGNGGFSLRRISKAIALIDQDADIAAWFSNTGSNEDLFFSFVGALSRDFVLPNVVEASLFAMEISPEILYEMNSHTLPMATHAFRKYSKAFWRDHLPEELFSLSS
jgi:hypothetical protein